MSEEQANSPAKKPKILTEMQEKFCQAYVAGGCGNRSGTACARDAGYKLPRDSAHQLLATPYVLVRIEELKKQRDSHFHAKMTNAENKLAEEGVTQEWVLRKTAKIADTEEAENKDKLKALEMLGEWLGMKVNRHADLTDEFKGKTQQELEFFATHGYFPDAVETDKSRVN